MRPCLIISGGRQTPISDFPKNSFVIACDKGVAYARKQGVVPDLVMGDFDSYGGPLPPGAEAVRLPPEKDDTDTMFAVKTALERGFTDLTLCCALGGRLDHLYANLQTAVYAACHGARCVIADEENWITVLKDGAVHLPRRDGFSLSLFSVSDFCRGVTAAGVKYPLNDAVLTNAFPLGVSNEWTAEEALVEVREGTLLIILSKL